MFPFRSIRTCRAVPPRKVPWTVSPLRNVSVSALSSAAAEQMRRTDRIERLMILIQILTLMTQPGPFPVTGISGSTAFGDGGREFRYDLFTFGEGGGVSIFL